MECLNQFINRFARIHKLKLRVKGSSFALLLTTSLIQLTYYERAATTDGIMPGAIRYSSDAAF
jgi:hypothetical protein